MTNSEADSARVWRIDCGCVLDRLPALLGDRAVEAHVLDRLLSRLGGRAFAAVAVDRLCLPHLGAVILTFLADGLGVVLAIRHDAAQIQTAKVARV